MPISTPAPDLAKRLSTITLPEAGGTQVTLGPLWKKQTVILVHLRHFG
jgi:hypothetical protein